MATSIRYTCTGGFMKYIKVILFAAVLFTVSGCKTQTSNIPVDPYLNVNVDFVKANCVPDEQYSFPVFGMYAMPSRTKNCAGVNDMWFVAWPGENTELEQSIAKVLTILYVKSENDNNDHDIRTTFIKYSSNAANDLHAAFYELSEVPPPKKEDEPQE